VDEGVDGERGSGEGREGRKAWMDMEDIAGQLKELRKRAEKVAEDEKRRRYEGIEEKRPLKPVVGLELKKDKVKFAGTEAEARVFFGGSSGAFGGKAESPIASGSIFSAGGSDKFRSNAWQMEFGY